MKYTTNPVVFALSSTLFYAFIVSLVIVVICKIFLKTDRMYSLFKSKRIEESLFDFGSMDEEEEKTFRFTKINTEINKNCPVEEVKMIADMGNISLNSSS